jgi:hypothetical protein
MGEKAATHTYHGNNKYISLQRVYPVVQKFSKYYEFIGNIPEGNVYDIEITTKVSYEGTP